MSEKGLLTYDDLIKRWQAPSDTPAARLKWVQRKCARMGLKKLRAFGGGKNARFRPVDVEKVEAQQAGEGSYGY